MLCAEGFLLSFSNIFMLLLFLAPRVTRSSLFVLLTAGSLYLLLLLLCRFQPVPESLAQQVLKPRGKVYSIAHRVGGGAQQHDAAPENTLAAIRLLSMRDINSFLVFTLLLHFP